MPSKFSYIILYEHTCKNKTTILRKERKGGVPTGLIGRKIPSQYSKASSHSKSHEETSPNNTFTQLIHVEIIQLILG